MADPFLGEIRTTAFNVAPRGWAFCNGQVLQIAQNQALFAVIGTTYGGDGKTTFKLPNLQGRTPIHAGNGIQLGASGGEANHAITVNEIPAHNHLAAASDAAPNVTAPGDATWAAVNGNYAAAPDGPMNANAISATGGGQAHANEQPYLVVSYIIALQGIFPSRS